MAIGIPDRRKCQYNAQELAVIRPFKDEYLAAESASARKIIAQTKICPALFNYWEGIDHGIRGEEETQEAIDVCLRLSYCQVLTSRQKLRRFLINNWRSKQTSTYTPGFTVKRSDILWWTRQEEVFDQIAEDMGLESANTSTPGWFPLRLPACKKIVDRMTESELADLDKEVENMRKKGVPPDIQQKFRVLCRCRCRSDADGKLFRLAEKQWCKRFDQAGKDHWMELGVLSLSFVVYNAPNGQLTIDM